MFSECLHGRSFDVVRASLGTTARDSMVGCVRVMSYHTVVGV